mmetsp:Transcript_2950/g.6384  ORF Transcript_2950/g.6384 Transcript_2950/m.6384 type:complete len:222 (+) Transcript_2950:9851-10516(+)
MIPPCPILLCRQQLGEDEAASPVLVAEVQPKVPHRWNCRYLPLPPLVQADEPTASPSPSAPPVVPVQIDTPTSNYPTPPPFAAAERVHAIVSPWDGAVCRRPVLEREYFVRLPPLLLRCCFLRLILLRFLALVPPEAVSPSRPAVPPCSIVSPLQSYPTVFPVRVARHAEVLPPLRSTRTTRRGRGAGSAFWCGPSWIIVLFSMIANGIVIACSRLLVRSL